MMLPLHTTTLSAACRLAAVLLVAFTVSLPHSTALPVGVVVDDSKAHVQQRRNEDGQPPSMPAANFGRLDASHNNRFNTFSDQVLSPIHHGRSVLRKRIEGVSMSDNPDDDLPDPDDDDGLSIADDETSLPPSTPGEDEADFEQESGDMDDAAGTAPTEDEEKSQKDIDASHEDAHNASCAESEKTGLLPQGTCETQSITSMLAGALRRRGMPMRTWWRRVEDSSASNSNNTESINGATPPDAAAQAAQIIEPVVDQSAVGNSTASAQPETPSDEEAKMLDSIKRLDELKARRAELEDELKRIEREMDDLFLASPYFSATLPL